VDVVTAMGSEVIAEGIESQSEVDLLLSIGVEAGQGRLWPAMN
jgi:EAL domain-containing protein (putative c-di-GMP-specific phosphodiesterase class I)